MIQLNANAKKWRTRKGRWIGEMGAKTPPMTPIVA